MVVCSPETKTPRARSTDPPAGGDGDGADGTAGAEAAGAAYLGVTVWSTATKPDAWPVGTEGLRAIARSTRLPVVGIGGIDARNAQQVVAAGARGVAVISAIAGAQDMVGATRELREAVDRALAGTGDGGTT